MESEDTKHLSDVLTSISKTSGHLRSQVETVTNKASIEGGAVHGSRDLLDHALLVGLNDSVSNWYLSYFEEIVGIPLEEFDGKAYAQVRL